MNPSETSDFTRLDRILDRLLDAPAEDRPRLLETLCADDVTRRRVARLLELAEDPEGLSPDGLGDLLPELDSDPADPEGRPPGEQVGPYTILGVIGRGGSSVVYRAERTDGQFEKRVALKLLRPGSEHTRAVRRFLRERQILASLEHPSIARLLDGGVTADGQPYFALELVEGEPIDVWCDARRLGIRQRLLLFRRVAEAVEAAHRELVVHRDLKTSNILVDDDGDPRLLDFGIAGLLDGGDRFDLTATALGWMTPAVASPEQIRHERVTVASDVYQLGLLLYVLLVAELPYRLDDAGPAIVERRICVEPAPAPSRRFAGFDPARREEVATARSLRPERLERSLDGDLDAIVGQCLRKRAARRYPTVRHLLDDLDRHLAGYPIRARPESALDRVGKFVRRHLVACTTATGVATLAALGVLKYTTDLRHESDTARAAEEREREARTEAEAALATAEEVSDFLVGLFEQADVWRAGDRDLTAREILDRGAARIEEDLEAPARIRSRLLATLGSVYGRFGDSAEATRLLEAALAAGGEGSEPGGRARTLAELANVHYREGRFAEAERLQREALAVMEGSGSGDPARLARTRTDLGWTLLQAGDPVGAAAEIGAALALSRTIGDAVLEANALNGLGAIADEEADYEESLRHLEAALAIRRRLFGSDHPSVATSLQNVGNAYWRLGRYDEAEPALEEAIRILEEISAPSLPALAFAWYQLGNLRVTRNRPDAAETSYRRAAELHEAAGREAHPDYAEVLNVLALLHRSQGRLDEARDGARRALGIAEAALGPDHARTGNVVDTLGWIALERGDLADARSRFEAAESIWSRALGPDHVDLAWAAMGLGETALRSGDPGAARRHFERAATLRRDTFGENHPETREAVGKLEALADAGAEPAGTR